MKNTVMVYKRGSRLQWQGRAYDFKVIDESEVAEALGEGWCAHPDDVYADRPAEGPEKSEDAPKRRGRPPKAVNVD